MKKGLYIHISGFGRRKNGYCGYCYDLSIEAAWTSIKTQTEKAGRGVCDHWKK